LSSTSDVVDPTQSEAPPAVFVTAEPEREVASEAVVTMPDAPAEQAPSTPVPVNTVPMKTGSPKRPGNIPQRAKSHRPGTFSGISHPTLPATPISTSPDARLRTHAGVVDQAALTSKPAKEVMDEVIRVLFEMGIEVKRESDFKLRCLRPRRKKAGATTGLGLSSVVSGGSLASVTMIGSASTGGVSPVVLPSCLDVQLTYRLCLLRSTAVVCLCLVRRQVCCRLAAGCEASCVAAAPMARDHHIPHRPTSVPQP
jgi:protein-serine/threonine kinase